MSKQNYRPQFPRPPVEYPRAPIQSQDAPVESSNPAPQHQEPPVEERNPRFWPTGVPMPDAYAKRRIPCPACRRLALDDGGRAVSVQQTGAYVVYLRCRQCDHRWAMPVE